MDEILSHVDSARHAIFTPNADEMVSKEEMVGAAAELEQQNPLIKKLGGPEAVQVGRGCRGMTRHWVHVCTRLRNMSQVLAWVRGRARPGEGHACTDRKHVGV